MFVLVCLCSNISRLMRRPLLGEVPGFNHCQLTFTVIQGRMTSKRGSTCNRRGCAADNCWGRVCSPPRLLASRHLIIAIVTMFLERRTRMLLAGPALYIRADYALRYVQRLGGGDGTPSFAG